MVNFNESEIDNITEELKERRDFFSFSKGMSSSSRIFFVGLVVAGVYYLSKNAITTKSVLLFGLILFVAYNVFKEETALPTLLDEQQVKAIVYERLAFKKKNMYGRSYEIEQSLEADINLACKLWRVDGEPKAYYVSFNLTKENTLMTTWTAEVDPYTGLIYGFEERPFGFMGNEKQSVKFIPHPDNKFAAMNNQQNNS